MASMLEQYEQASTRSTNVGQRRTTIPEPVTSGFINARLEDETPIFNKQRINFKPPATISHLEVCNSYLVMAMTNNALLRIDLEHPEQPDEVELKGTEGQIHQMFLDPTGRHLLISMETGDNYYLHKSARKPRSLAKMKSHMIDSVGWNRQNQSDTTTREILLGTSRGLIFETEIQAGDDNRFFQGSLDQYWKQLFNLGSKDKPTPVTGLEFDRMQVKSMTEAKYFIMATTARRLFQFIGTISTSTEPPIFQKIFQPYEDQPERFLDLPDGLDASQLHFYHTKFRDPPSSFAWMAGPGVYYGNVDVSGNAGQDTVTTNCKLIAYQRDEVENQMAPVSIVLTEFHLLVLFPDRLKAMCVLNEQAIFDDAMSDRFGRLRGMCKDPVRGTIWAFTEQAVFKYKIVKEARDVWQIYLDKGEFALARQYCRDNPAYVDRVTTKEAEHLFKTKKYEESAMLYAQTQNSFEEIALKFIQIEEKDALKLFLMKKLGSLNVKDKTQITMIVTWLIEIWLNQLGELREQGQEMSEKYEMVQDDFRKFLARKQVKLGELREQGQEMSEKYERVQDDFRKFLARKQVKECLMYNRNTVYDLIASHGDIDDMVYFAILMQDYERVIEHHLQHDSYTEALKILTEQCKENQKLVYKYAPLLMQNIPKETVTACIRLGKKLDPKDLIPALVQYDHKKYRAQANETIRYLEFCVETLQTSDVAIHNYLLSQYAKIQPERLMTYLNIQGEDAESVNYDLKYALRLCSEHDLKRACVHIYTTMGLYEEAVDLALKVDVDIAKEKANKPTYDEELRKKLWLRIARHVVEEEEDIKRAMEFLNECDLLKIEDILPFFPDFVTIDHFKDAICTSLEQYNQHIERLKEEMEEATESAREIRSEIQTFRNKFAFIKAQDKCASCSFPILTRSFYVFPCMHRFHTDCLVAEVLPHLKSASRRRVEELQRKIASRDDGPLPAHSREVTADMAPKEELDEIVAAECILCGDFMIRCIDKPFIEREEQEAVMQSWE